MGMLVDYLVYIYLLDKKVFRREHALTGEEIRAMIKTEAQKLMKALDADMFDAHFPETLATAIDPQQQCSYVGFVKLATTRKPQYRQQLLDAGYWLHNARKGWPFMYGIEEERLSHYNGGYPLRQIGSLAGVQDEDDFWGFANTWLSRNWRT
ncbi:hypothetical protein HYV81_02165 [Candidatus Woesearchaeota archaeon]|nr:hypothetical protein [Candidatus Woesearchaeota archaeon]